MSKTCLVNATEVTEYAAQFIDVSVKEKSMVSLMHEQSERSMASHCQKHVT